MSKYLSTRFTNLETYVPGEQPQDHHHMAGVGADNFLNFRHRDSSAGGGVGVGNDNIFVDAAVVRGIQTKVLM